MLTLCVVIRFLYRGFPTATGPNPFVRLCLESFLLCLVKKQLNYPIVHRLVSQPRSSDSSSLTSCLDTDTVLNLMDADGGSHRRKTLCSVCLAGGEQVCTAGVETTVRASYLGKWCVFKSRVQKCFFPADAAPGLCQDILE